MYSSLISPTLSFNPSTSKLKTSSQRAIKTRTNLAHGFKVSCNVAPNDHNNEKQLILPETEKLILPNVDRRNLIVGLGGLYTAAGLTTLPSALADPIVTPDISLSCKDAKAGIRNIEGAVRTAKCCPPNIGKAIQPFKFPKKKEPVRMRWPAHKGSKENVEKYKRAIQAMKDLPDEHPHSFASQAKIHCAYCNGGYTQELSDGAKLEIQIHNSWLFFPFHRWYLYFYERILGKLINDPTFALPYWSWDDPEGMMVPDFFLVEKEHGDPNPVFDVYRDAGHIPQVVDLAYAPKRGQEAKAPLSSEKQKECNLVTVYRDLIRNATDSKSFFGGEYRAEIPAPGQKPASVGSVESGCHTAVHRWVGDATQPNSEDMGNFYSAGYDPLFYVHHANVDRMWKLWKDLGIQGHEEPNDADWLNASYVFYDENENLVRVTNKDSIKINALKYGYEETKGSEISQWKKSRPAPRGKKTKKNKKNKNSKTSEVESSEEVKTVEQTKFPVTLDKILKVRVKRPEVNRTAEEKVASKETLMINDIQFDGEVFVKFDVFVNDNVDDGVFTTPCDPEFAGGFAQVPHSGMKKMKMSSAVRFGLTELLEDTKTEDEEYAVVTLVPRTGCDDLTVGDIKIELVSVV